MRKTMTKTRERQLMIEEYKRQAGIVEIDPKKVAEFALQKGWKEPRQKSAVELLAEEFAQAARETIRIDEETGQPYRAYHSVEEMHGQTRFHFYVDIEDITRPRMHKSLIGRREQTIGDVLQLTFDADRWNRVHPDEAPIDVPTDYTLDVQIRKNAPKMIDGR